MLKIPTLPNEVLDSILTVLQVDGDFSTLCSVAQASWNMYEIAIPKIYETVVINKRNQRKIMFGHGKSFARFNRGGKSYMMGLLRYELTYRHNEWGYSERSSGRLHPQVGIQRGTHISDLKIL